MAVFSFQKQFDSMDCGPACLSMVARHYGRRYSLEYLRSRSYITKEGVNLLGISEAAEKIGFRTLAVKVELQKLIDNATLPCILHWNQNHFVVLYKAKGKFLYIADPAHGLLKLNEREFLKCWQGTASEGIALLLETTESFFKTTEEFKKSKSGFRFLYKYVKPYQKYFLQICISMLIGSLFALIFPFLTQSLVDTGIGRKNLGFVNLILVSQLVLFAGSLTIELLRGWLLLHINSRVNIAIISDFLAKLMRLPISYFDTKHMGDIKQRISDHGRVQTFLTGSALSTLFSLCNLVVFSVVLGLYSLQILLIFSIFSALSVGWITIFLKKRKLLDYVRFQRLSQNENILYELITGMQEIKLNNCERVKRWSWERSQARIFKLNIKSMSLAQTQQIGSIAFSQIKNIFISFLAAREVIQGNMTLGMMMSVSYIIGQLNNPIQLLLIFIQTGQDAKISLDRLGEIHNKEEEEESSSVRSLSLLEISKNGDIKYDTFITDDPQIEEATGKKSGFELDDTPISITLNDVSFQYTGPNSPFVLKNICMQIPHGKVTAIVGTSGSGKTTLIKMLLRFYEPVSGSIQVNGTNLATVSPKWWRNKCGIVMQEGYIFSDSIASNISMNDEKVDHFKLNSAVTIANIKDFIETLPLTYNTKLGNTGNGISSGQKQRILIARAVYKNPEFLFFDEATSALDANNERVIMENLSDFFEGKTVVVIAHRLSTVKNADQIIVLSEGEIVEKGTHMSLVSSRGKYYELVKNQLELGN